MKRWWLLPLTLLCGTLVSAQTVNHYLYVFVPGSVYVYDLDNNLALVKTKPFTPTSGLSAVHIRGVVASAVTGMLYVSYGSYGPGGTGSLAKYNVATDTVVWTQNYTFPIDSMSISPDGTTIYMPDGETSGNGNVEVINASTGALVTTYTVAGTGPHNSWVNPSGTHLYIGPRVTGQLFELNAATGATIQTFATVNNSFGNGVRPFTPDPTETYVFVTPSDNVEFFTQSVATGATLFTSVPPGFAHTGPFTVGGNSISGVSHGIEVSSDGKYVWLIDLPGNAVHKFDVRGLPRLPPVDVRDIHLSCTMSDEGWLEKSMDGRFIMVGDCGDVISTATDTVVGNAAQLQNTRIYTEVDLQSNTVINSSLSKNGTWNVSGPGTVVLNPTSYNFGNVATGFSSATEVITAYNRGGSAFNMSSPVVSGANAADFAINVGSTTCGPSSTMLVGGGSCTVGIIFTPSAVQAESAILTFTDTASGLSQTLSLSGAGVTGTNLTACGNLSTANATYVLQNDLTATGNCLTFTAAGITLDLNGHTITYDTAATSGVFGITSSPIGTRNLHVTNGTVNQSANCGLGTCVGSHVFKIIDLEADHITSTWTGDNTEGFEVPGNSPTRVLIHDNTLRPNGTKNCSPQPCTPTHFGNFATIYLRNFGGNFQVYNNDIEGKGYIGIEYDFGGQAPSPCFFNYNTIKMAAPVRDGYGVTIDSGTNTNVNCEVAFNTIIQSGGRGIIAEGNTDQNSPGPGAVSIHDNFIDVREPANEGNSVGDPLGIQARFGAHGVQIFNNTIHVHSGVSACPTNFPTDTGAGCVSQGAIKLMAGATGLNNQATNNTIFADTTDTTSPVSALYGDFVPDAASGFFNNTVTSNNTLVDMSQPDGCGSGWTLSGNTFIQGSNPQNFLTYHPVWFCNSGQNTNNNVFIDNIYEGAANNPDNINGPPTGSNSFSYFVKWSYIVIVRNAAGAGISGATVTATSTGAGTETVTGTTDSTGTATLVLTNHSASGTSPGSPTTTTYTPHNISISAAGFKTLNYSVTITGTLVDVRTLPSDIYLAQTAAGTSDGSSCANALAVSFFNASGNWGTGATQIGSGTTVHLCGNPTPISSSLVVPASQGTGLITLKWEPGALMQQPAAAVFISGTSTNSWLFTGQAPCGFQNQNPVDVACPEKIQNTANGSPSHFANSVVSRCFDLSAFSGASVTIQNLECSNLYVHNDVNDTGITQTAVNCVYANPLLTNLTVKNGVCHDSGWAINITGAQANPGLSEEISGMDLFNNDHDWIMGSVCTNGCITAKFHNNHSHDHTTWNTTADAYHHDGIHAFNSQTQDTATYVYDNLFDGPWTGNGTAIIFNQVALQNLYLFNNVSICDSTCTSDPPLWEYSGGPNQGTFNNTIIQTGLAPGPGPNFLNNAAIYFALPGGETTSNNSFMNNVMTSATTLFNTTGPVYAAPTATTGIDYNLYANYIANGNTAWVWNGTSTNSFATWQSLSGGDAHSLFVSNANLSATGVPQSGSAAIGSGTNLTSLCVGALIALCHDYSGVARPSSGAWDMGAFFIGGAPSVSIVPTSVNFGNNLLNSPSSKASVTLTNTGSAQLSITSITFSGLNPGDFGQSNNCGSSLGAGGSCTLTITFTASLLGPRSASVLITDNASGSPQTVALSGTGSGNVTGTGSISGSGIIKVGP